MSELVINGVMKPELLFDQLKIKLPDIGMEAQRLFHGRGHCFEGLEFINIDYYLPVFFITLYEDPGEELIRSIQGFLLDVVDSDVCEAIIVQKRFVKGAPCDVLWGSIPDKLYAIENGLKYNLKLNGNQNIGFFPDMVIGRQWVRGHSKGRHVLNLFSYTCSLSVAAMVGGADSVVNVDVSRSALQIGRLNHQLNGLDVRAVDFMPYDIFRSWGNIKRKGPYDLLIIDPPTFQKGRFDVRKDYGRVVRRIPELMVAGGDVLACVNSPRIGTEFLIDLFGENLIGGTFVERLPGGETFPEKFEDMNLKACWFTILDGN